ncbi:MAG TPA: ROK family transcriptional regulator [Sediminispirochaeta sp.]|nr:ROK family transcriptional regulator [Sediminispirochaeta sp.]
MIRGNQSFQKAANIALVMREIRHRSPISRTEISQVLGLTKSTVSTIVADLLEVGLLNESNLVPSETKGGRPRMKLELKKETACIVGVELDPSRYKSVIIDIDGTEISRSTGTIREDRRSKSWHPDPVSAFDSVFQEIRQQVESVHLPVIGIGVGIPGYIEPVKGRILRSTAFDVENMDYTRPLSEKYELPILVENDANCIAWGEIAAEESSDGSPEKPYENLITVLLQMHRDLQGRHLQSSPGIGCGIVMDGMVRYGENFAAGEFHSYRWHTESPGQLGSVHGGREAEDESRFIEEMLEELFQNLSLGVSLLSPARVVYAGDLLEYEGQMKRILSERMAGSFINPEVSGIPIDAARFGESAVAAGAAFMLLERLFLLPEVGRTRPEGMPTWNDVISKLRAETK